MEKRSMKRISKILVLVMVLSTALPQGIDWKSVKFKKTNAYAQEVSGEISTTDIDSTTKEASTGETVTGETGTKETVASETTTVKPTSEQPTTMNPDFVVQNGVLVKYAKAADDKNNKEIHIPASITKIEKGVFNGYKYIEKVTFDQGSQMKEIGEQAFLNCIALKSVQLPEGLTTIGNESFSGCTALSDINIPKTTITIGNTAFYRCNSIKTMTLPEGLSTIGYHAFYDMNGITSLIIPSTVISANEILGSKSKVTTVTFATGMLRIPDKVLLKATSVKTVVMYKGLTEIGISAFSGCTNLTTTEIPSTVKRVRGSAFKNCSSLKTISFYKALTSITSTAFNGCTKLTVKVYSNSYGKSFARKYNLKWKYKATEKARMTEDKRVYDLLMSKSTAKYKNKFALQNLSDYIPQGTCVIGKYIVVSMYHKNLSKKSMLVIYDKKGNYVKKVYLTVKDHVGSITNIKNNLVVGINNVPGARDQVGIIKYGTLKKAKGGSTVKFKYRLTLSGAADFASYDGTYYWAGRSANSNNCLMYGYKVTFSKSGKIKLKNKFNLYVPANTQGLIAKKVSSTQRTFTLSQSYGRIADSYLKQYDAINIKSVGVLSVPTKTAVMPSMLEGICMYGTKIISVYESGAGKYCGNPDNTSEIQIKNLNVIKYTTLLKLK